MPPVVNRRQLLQTAAALVAPTVLPAWAAPLPQLTLSGPPAIVSAPLIHMAQSNALAGVAAKTVFTPWRDPDQLRVMAIGNKATSWPCRATSRPTSTTGARGCSC